MVPMDPMGTGKNPEKNIHFGHAFSGNSRRAITPTPRQAGNVVAMQILGTGLGLPVRMIWAHYSVLS